MDRLRAAGTMPDMGLRTTICAPILGAVVLLCLAYATFRNANYIVLYDWDSDGRYEVHLRNHPRPPSGPLELRWWFVLTRPAMGMMAQIEAAYRSLTER